MSAAVVTDSGATAKLTPVKGGGFMLSPAPLAGGRRRRMTKKMKKMLKAMKKLKGGELEGVVDAATEEEKPAMGGRRRRTRRSRAGLFA
jgi:hypothetical protein